MKSISALRSAAAARFIVSTRMWTVSLEAEVIAARSYPLSAFAERRPKCSSRDRKAR
jgi:hypothetical protein